MPKEFKRGQRFEWSFRWRKVVGTVQRKLTRPTSIAGQRVVASGDDPRYVLKTEKSGRLTTRRAQALKVVKN